jgi:hypothetical protein
MRLRAVDRGFENHFVIGIAELGTPSKIYFYWLQNYGERGHNAIDLIM